MSSPSGRPHRLTTFPRVAPNQITVQSAVAGSNRRTVVPMPSEYERVAAAFDAGGWKSTSWTARPSSVQPNRHSASCRFGPLSVK